MCDHDAEKRHKPEKFTFEDVPLNEQTVRELIVDEIVSYNPQLLREPSIRAISLRANSLRHDLREMDKQVNKGK